MCLAIPGQVLVIDPGTYTEPTAVDGADAVLVTHEHADHVDAGRLKAAQTASPALAVYGHVAVVDQLSEVGVEAQSIAVGDRFTVAGFGVRAVGGELLVLDVEQRPDHHGRGEHEDRGRRERPGGALGEHLEPHDLLSLGERRLAQRGTAGRLDGGQELLRAVDAKSK